MPSCLKDEWSKGTGVIRSRLETLYPVWSRLETLYPVLGWDGIRGIHLLLPSPYLRGMRSIFLLLLLCGFLTACSSSKSSAPASAPENAALTQLQRAMTGSFDSSAQARSDESYYNILLNMQPIWEDRGYYLYVEQAVADAPERPYRQRVYRLEKRGRKFYSHVYELPDPEAFVGAYDAPERFANLTPAQLKERPGCAVILKREKGNIWRGETKDKDCKSTLRGATYAKSRVTITNSFVQSWDQGFNDADEQVWGATEGGYMFFKQ